jgi:hypothetical protein
MDFNYTLEGSNLAFDSVVKVGTIIEATIPSEVVA